MPDAEAPGGQQDQQQGEQQPQEGTEQTGTEQQPEQPAAKTYSEDYVRELRAEAAKYRTQAKASLTETERAVMEAEERGRLAVRTEYSQRLARERFDSLAARRNPEVKTRDMLEYVNLDRFITEDGELDERALNAAVNRLIPDVQQQPSGPPGFDGGARTTAQTGPDFNDTIRSQLRSR